MKIRIVQLLFFMGMLSGGIVWGQERVITTAVPFLRISPDARASGMGDVGVATSADAYAGLWNMGKVAFNKQKAAVVAGYSPWLRDITNDMYLASLAGFYKLNEDESISGGFRYFNLGDAQFSDEIGNYFQNFRPREWALDVGYSRKLGDRMGLGVALRYIHSQLSDVSADGTDYKAGTAVAADLGYYYTTQNSAGNGWSFGAALTNLGSKIAYNKESEEKDFIPANLGLGAAYNKAIDAQNRISIGLDVNKLLVPTMPENGDSAAMADYRNKSVIGSWFSSFGDAPDGFSEELKEFQVGAGAEYWYNEQFAVRAGYAWESKDKGNRRYVTVGAGVKYKMLQLNFSYLAPTGSGVNRSPLANTLRFGLVWEP
jgi:hypothetical protein